MGGQDSPGKKVSLRAERANQGPLLKKSKAKKDEKRNSKKSMDHSEPSSVGMSERPEAEQQGNTSNSANRRKPPYIGKGRCRKPSRKKPKLKKSSSSEVPKKTKSSKKGSLDPEVAKKAVWYFGVMKQIDIEFLFRFTGDFGIRIRKRPCGIHRYVLSVRGETRCYHRYVVRSHTGWKMFKQKEQHFNSIPELICFYKTNPLNFPGEPELKLRNGALRPGWIIRKKDVQVQDKSLGKGNFSSVFIGIYSGKQVAVKVCHQTVNNDEPSEEVIDAKISLLKEGNLMSMIHHRNVIKYYGITSERSLCMLVMEFCPGGSLVNHLINAGNKIELPEKMKYCVEAAEGIRYIHSRDVIHRDLAARNCLVNNLGVVKIADFGLSAVLMDMPADHIGNHLPLGWMAPETINRKPIYSKASDVWSYGVLMYEIFNNGGKPWNNFSYHQIAKAIKSMEMLEFPPVTPNAIKSLVSNDIWVKEPENRVNFDEICRVLQRIYDIIKPEVDIHFKLSLSYVKGVTAMREGDLEVIRKFSEDQDIAVEADFDHYPIYNPFPPPKDRNTVLTSSAESSGGTTPDPVILGSKGRKAPAPKFKGKPSKKNNGSR